MRYFVQYCTKGGGEHIRMFTNEADMLTFMRSEACYYILGKYKGNPY